ncbi:DUF1161 domain-containing protein [Variovorax sp. PAMC 28711]|uniref:DUF1161 domain-containing protein n=1 Tax=Variovorax sp. PAMC 28711 TaxID=1795631 RepID=UPI00078D4BA0|nr:DUF1161 domain-containing protein [Variovorax sp. PAMC 28711]AMM23617.1 hypothetical protein AX767_04120 [Variovorax sp. PAMC 28711]
MLKLWLIPLTFLAAGTAGAATSCETLRADIEAKIGAAGVTRFTVTTVDANTPASGQVVGSCELGNKKIVYVREGGAVADAGAARPRSEPMLTECKDGSVSVGGDCRK